MTRRWERHGWTVHLAEPAGTGPWVKGEALAPALRYAADPVVIADADVWPLGIDDAYQAVVEGASWAVPHWQVYRLTERATRGVLAGWTINRSTVEALAVERQPYVGLLGGGVTVIRKAAALDVPIDRRFTRWGGEDDSWGKALVTLVGDPHRIEHGDPLVHLYHPHAHPDRPAVGGSMDNEYLRRRYFSALNDTTQMRALVEEGRSWPRS